MSTEIEAAGALIDASLVANEIERSPGGGHTGAHDSQCRNCGAPLQGRFCHVCGQSAHIHRSLLHLGEELLHGLLHFDGKSWRTLPMLVAKPGQLTRRYIEGQRARYVSPLALFLFMVFLMFFAASLTSAPSDAFGNSGAIVDLRVDVEKDLDKARAEVAKAREQLAQAQAGQGDIESAKETLDDAQSELAVAERAASAVFSAADAALPRAASAATAASAASAAPEESASAPAGGHRVPAWALALRENPLKSGHPDLDTAVRNAADNPELTLYKLKNTAYKFSFMLVPISLPFLWLMFFWRRGIAMYDHAVFVLYSLSFMSLLFVVLTGLAALHAGKLVPLVATFAPPIHIAAQLHGAYRLGFWGTLWRTIVLLIVSAIVFAMFLLFIVYLTMR